MHFQKVADALFLELGVVAEDVDGEAAFFPGAADFVFSGDLAVVDEELGDEELEVGGEAAFEDDVAAFDEDAEVGEAAAGFGWAEEIDEGDDHSGGEEAHDHLVDPGEIGDEDGLVFLGERGGVSDRGDEQQEGGGGEAARVFGEICWHGDTLRARGRATTGMSGGAEPVTLRCRPTKFSRKSVPPTPAKKLILFPNSPTLLGDVPLFTQEPFLMAERAVFLDRDNTIIDNDGYLGDPSKVKLLTGAATALSAIRARGYRMIVVSNQSGVARGMFDENAVEAVNQEMCKQLREQAGAHIDASYYCPYHPEAPIAEYRVDHEWRKPKPGMLKQAAADFGLDLSQCWTIGDQPRDIAAGAAAGTRTILLRDPDHKSTDADPPSLEVSPNFIVKTLADAARIIAREGKNNPATAAAAQARAADSPNQLLPASAPNTAAVRNDAMPVQHAVSNAATATEAAQTALAPAIDENELVEKLAQRLGKLQATAAPANSSRIEKSLEDLVAQLRTQNRAAEAPPDFSGMKFAGIIVQIFALLALAAGLYGAMNAKATWKDTYDVIVTGAALLRGIIWLLTALVLQGFAGILLRNKK